ncbi:hypothetical protein Anapl_05205 [Anas platyrhynchos]|uniref:Uncharacterized protein n=1 Tax=Anas platyrhynchos TaxID=8839 RepID=R0L4K5_ANAPL|nr:hypothetical protein Anapl_05205 [Anas platyrhynchos]
MCRVQRGKTQTRKQLRNPRGGAEVCQQCHRTCRGANTSTPRHNSTFCREGAGIQRRYGVRRGGGENTRKHRDLRASALHRRLGGAFEGGYRSQSCSAGCWSIKAALLLKSYQGKGEEKEERIYGTTQLGASRDCLQTAEMLPGGFPIPMIWALISVPLASRSRDADHTLPLQCLGCTQAAPATCRPIAAVCTVPCLGQVRADRHQKSSSQPPKTSQLTAQGFPLLGLWAAEPHSPALRSSELARSYSGQQEAVRSMATGPGCEKANAAKMTTLYVKNRGTEDKTKG